MTTPNPIDRANVKRFCIYWLYCSAVILSIALLARQIASLLKNETVVFPWWSVLIIAATGAICAALLSARSDRL